MHIPRTWAKVSANTKFPDGKTLPVSVWGWGDDEASAKRRASDRLKSLLDRLRRGESFPADHYAYGNRPLKEEIVQTITNGSQSEPIAIVTRNSQGAQVLNAARLLFLDVDFRPLGFIESIKRLFGGPSLEEKTRTALRDALRNYRRATFRLYRTAHGFRAIAIDRDFDPLADEVQELMQATATDPAYARLCRAQQSFRARLTPKHWRCDSPPPPGQHPRSERGLQQRFASWLGEYEKASSRYATCRYLETIGKGRPNGDAKELLALHDRMTRCDQTLPLA